MYEQLCIAVNWVNSCILDNWFLKPGGHLLEPVFCNLEKFPNFNFEVHDTGNA